jgi:transposase-like protein
MSDLNRPEFHDETKAREWLETELWPNGPVCPHCGVVDEATLLKGKSHRPGLYQCNACRKPFTVTVGTLYERSHIPLHKWLAATHLLMASKKGMSSLQIHRMLGVSKKTAWFLCHRIRESLRPVKGGPLGGEGKTAEADESYIGGKDKNRHANKRKGFHGTQGKEPVFSLVERGGSVRSFHLPDVKGDTLRSIVRAHMDGKTIVYTDDNHTTQFAVAGYKSETVQHSIGEYVRGDAHTNTIEGYFSILKRGIVGTYHHVSQQHLKRYLAEFDYRYNERMALGMSDAQRMRKSMRGIVGKRLTYRRTGLGPNV